MRTLFSLAARELSNKRAKRGTAAEEAPGPEGLRRIKCGVHVLYAVRSSLCVGDAREVRCLAAASDTEVAKKTSPIHGGDSRLSGRVEKWQRGSVD